MMAGGFEMQRLFILFTEKKFGMNEKILPSYSFGNS